jgi:hypothetical protein
MRATDMLRVSTFGDEAAITTVGKCNVYPIET